MYGKGRLSFAVASCLLIPNLLSFVFSGASWSREYDVRAALANRADIFATIAQDVFNG